MIKLIFSIFVLWLMNSNSAFAQNADHYVHGIQYSQQGRWDDAVSEFKIAIDEDPNNPTAHYNLATAYAHLGKWGSATDEYQATINLDSSNADAYGGLGVAYEKSGNPTLAINYYQKALQRDYNLTWVHENLGKLYVKIGQIDQAEQEYQTLVQQGSSQANALFNAIKKQLGAKGQNDESNQSEIGQTSETTSPPVPKDNAQTLPEEDTVTLKEKEPVPTTNAQQDRGGGPRNIASEATVSIQKVSSNQRTDDQPSGGGLFYFLFFVVLGGLCFTPTIIAFSRNDPNKWVIFRNNILIITAIGAITYSLSQKKRSKGY